MRNRWAVHRRRRGMTLVELLVVLIIIISVAGMSLPLIAPFFGSRQMDQATTRVQMACLRAKSLAVTHREKYAVFFDADTQSVAIKRKSDDKVVGDPEYLPENVVFSGLPTGPVVFTPSGGLEGGTETIYVVGPKPGETGTASSAANGPPNFLEDDSKAWASDLWLGQYVIITDGTGAGQARYIESNTAIRLKLRDQDPWDTVPDVTSKYRIPFSVRKIRILSTTGEMVWE